MAHRKETVKCIWGPQLADLSSHPALKKKRKICDSRGVVWFADRSYKLYNFETCVNKRKKDKKEKRTKSTFSRLILLTVRRNNGTLGVHFTLEKLRVFIYKSFASLYCVYLGAAPIA